MPSSSRLQRHLFKFVYLYKINKLDTSSINPSFLRKIKKLASRISLKDLKDLIKYKRPNIYEKDEEE